MSSPVHCRAETATQPPWQIGLVVDHQPGDDLSSAAPEEIGFVRVELIAQFPEETLREREQPRNVVAT